MDFSWLTNFFGKLLDKINSFFSFFGDLIKAAFLSLWDLFLDALCFLVDSLIKVIDAALSVLPQQTATDWGRYWADVPAGVVEVAVAVGIVPALAIITVALIIRFGLQLIPFVRLGS